MSSPKFSVILPSHNGADRIRTALNSIKSQTYKNYELIVVCDSCTDNTAEIAYKYTSKVINVNHGRDGLARNAGLDAANGEWILFIDDDDYFLHEYCFALLADKVGRNGEDVLDFSFIWKDIGYKNQTPDDQFVMVWCRAWKRSFIGEERFISDPYGSDKEFYNRMIHDNEDVIVTFWHCPIYYYNYLREGSLSWMEKQKKYLDFIITHYDEPWELGKPFFDMIEHQRCADKRSVTFTIVQDGEEGALPWDDLLSQYSYKVNVITIPHKGTSGARNAGLKATSAPWVMFCNFDDMLGDVCSLSMILENFPTDEYDIIWSRMVQECKWYTDVIYMNRIEGVNFSNTDAKMYRRQFLEENDLYFDETEQYYYGHIFNAMALALTKPFRIATLTTEFFPYYKTLRMDSQRHTDDAFQEMMHNVFERDVKIAENFRKRGLDYNYGSAVVKTLARQYYDIYDPTLTRKTDKIPDRVIEYFRDHKKVYYSVSKTDIEPILAEAEVEVMNFIQSYYNEHKREYYLVNDEIVFEDWINCIECALEKEQTTSADDTTNDADIVISDPVIVPADPQPAAPETQNEQEPRVVVYCGTFDVYMNMVASLKSLLCMTPVDKVYFLIEDDTFPYELPDIVECVNVKNQTWFDPAGPNFKNAWTWMCMMRATFPEILPYKKILSLDVDIVINDNVSDLWDYDISDYYLAGVPERQRQKSSSDPVYINFGVVLMNLEKLRQDGVHLKVIEALNKNHFGCPEQDAYNKFCAGHILPIPADFNYTTYSHITADAQKERIIHYAGQKFWRHYAMVKQYSDRSWDDIMTRQAQLQSERN